MKCFLLRQLVRLALFLCLACPARAKTIFLSTTGSDSAPCENGSEFATFSAALGCLGPGDTLFVRNGSYAGGPLVSLTGTAEAPVVIRGQSLEAIIDTSNQANRDNLRLDHSSHVVVENLTFRRSSRAGLGIIRSDHITVRGCVFADNYKWGLFTGFADDVLFENNESYGTRDEHGIYHSNSGDRFIIRGNHINGDPELIDIAEGDDGVINYGIVERNVIHDNGSGGGGGINMTHVRDVIVRNNLLYNNLAGGFTFYADTNDKTFTSELALIMHNTVYFKPDSGRAVVNVAPTSEAVVLVNNILVTGGNSTSRPVLQIWSDYPATIHSDYNILWGIDSTQIATVSESQTYTLGQWKTNRASDARSQYSDPLFISIDEADFALSESSPAVDTAAPLDSVRVMVARLDSADWLLGRLDSLNSDDLNGNPRPVGAGPDIGAIESRADPQSLYDFNNDSRFSVADVLTLLIRGMGNPANTSFDIDGDGRWGADDVLALLKIMIAKHSNLALGSS